MLATFIYSIGIPVTRPQDPEVKDWHQLRHQADEGFCSHVKSRSLVFSLIGETFQNKNMITSILTFGRTAGATSWPQSNFSPNKTLRSSFLTWQRGKWLINHGSPRPFLIRTNYQKWEQLALGKKKLHFEGRVNYDGADALQRSPCRDRLSVPLCSALLASFHPFLSADFRVLSYLFVHKYSCCFHLRGCPTSRGSDNGDCHFGSNFLRGVSLWDPFLCEWIGLFMHLFLTLMPLVCVCDFFFFIILFYEGQLE